jgi:hypothetical protein
MPQLPTQWAVQQRHLSCTQGVTCVRGRRALLLLVLLHEKGVRAGYMKCCMGSGRPHAERMRATLKRTERVHEGWGMHAMAGFKSRHSASATDRSGQSPYPLQPPCVLLPEQSPPLPPLPSL